MSSTPDNTGVLPIAQDHLLTDEEFVVLKSHVLTKFFRYNCTSHFRAPLNMLINSLAEKLDYVNSHNFLQRVNEYVFVLQNYSAVCNAANTLTVIDAPVLIRLYKMLDVNYFLQSIDKKIKYMN